MGTSCPSPTPSASLPSPWRWSEQSSSPTALGPSRPSSRRCHPSKPLIQPASILRHLSLFPPHLQLSCCPDPHLRSASGVLQFASACTARQSFSRQHVRTDEGGRSRWSRDSVKSLDEHESESSDAGNRTHFSSTVASSGSLHGMLLVKDEMGGAGCAMTLARCGAAGGGGG